MKRRGSESSFEAAGKVGRSVEYLWQTDVEKMFEELMDRCDSEAEATFLSKIQAILTSEEKFCLKLKILLERYRNPMIKAKKDLPCYQVADSFPNKCVHGKNPTKCHASSWESVKMFDMDLINSVFGNISQVYRLSHRFKAFILYRLAEEYKTSDAFSPIEIDDVVEIFGEAFQNLEKNAEPLYSFCLNLEKSKADIEKLKVDPDFLDFSNKLRLPGQGDSLTPEEAIENERIAEKFSLHRLIELPYQRIKGYPKLLNSLMKSFRHFLAAKLSLEADSDEFEKNREQVDRIMKCLDKTQVLVKSLEATAREKVEFWEIHTGMTQVFQQLGEYEAADPSQHPERRLISKNDVFVVDKTKESHSESGEDALPEEYTLFLFNDLLILSVRDKESETILNTAEKMNLKSKHLKGRTSRGMKKKSSRFGSLASKTSLGAEYRKQSGFLTLRKTSARRSGRKQSTMLKTTMATLKKNRRSIRSVMSEELEPSARDRDSVVSIRKGIKKNKTLVTVEANKRYKVLFAFDLEKVFMKDIRPSPNEGFAFCFSFWGKYIEKVSAPLSEEEDIIPPINNRNSSIQLHKKADHLFSQQKHFSISSHRSEDGAVNPVMESDEEEVVQKTYNKVHPRQRNMDNRTSRFRKSHAKSTFPNGNLKRHGFELCFATFNECEDMQGLIMNAKKKYENTNGGENGGATTTRTRRKRFSKRNSRKKSTNSVVSASPSRTIRSKSRESRASSAAALCYQDFQPKYIKKSP